MVDTTYPIQLHVQVNSSEIILISHQSSCGLEFISMAGCFDCLTPPTATFNCETSFGSTTITFQCDKSTIDPFRCSNQTEAHSTSISVSTALVNDNCTAKCPANSIEFMLVGQLESSSTADHEKNRQLG